MNAALSGLDARERTAVGRANRVSRMPPSLQQPRITAGLAPKVTTGGGVHPMTDVRDGTRLPCRPSDATIPEDSSSCESPLPTGMVASGVQANEPRPSEPTAPNISELAPQDSHELQLLIAAQKRDDTHRVYSLSLDAMCSGADVTQIRRRQLVNDPMHGTLTCYTQYRCRCGKCRAAAAAWKRGWRARSAKVCVGGCGRKVSGERHGRSTPTVRCVSCAMKAVWAKRKAACA